MSRSSRGPAPTASSHAGTDGNAQTYGGSDDICPVCKSSRYMNPNMRFLVNPECYHRMCASCVDRIFAAGRAKCPIARCPKMLRKGGFRKQLFEDVKMEREKDVREEVAEVFNRREEDFNSLKDYNDYLELAEDVSFGLINGIDVEENRRKLQQYKDENKASIAVNKRAEQEEEAEWAYQQAEEKRLTQLKRKQVKEEEEGEKVEREQAQKRVLDDMTKGKGDADEITRKALERIKEKARMRNSDKVASSTTDGEKSSFVIRGLKQPSRAEPEKPYSPFGDLAFRPIYFTPPTQTGIESIEKEREDATHAAGGYDIDGYCVRALTMGAFAGLGVFVGGD